jgi:hypothetical protein
MKGEPAATIHVANMHVSSTSATTSTKPAAVVEKAFYLCDNGARDNRDLRGAIWNYNADWYVDKVLT